MIEINENIELVRQKIKSALQVAEEIEEIQKDKSKAENIELVRQKTELVRQAIEEIEEEIEELEIKTGAKI